MQSIQKHICLGKHLSASTMSKIVNINGCGQYEHLWEDADEYILLQSLSKSSAEHVYINERYHPPDLESSITNRETATCIAGRETSITGRETAITDRETAITDRETAIAEIETPIAARETPFTSRETAITDSETAITDRETPITDGEMAKTGREPSITERETAITGRETTIIPLHAFRPGYLWVSDFTSQHWCEQKLYYGFTLPVLVEETPAMTAGTDLHLTRELAVHDIVKVTITSQEDRMAVKVLNLLHATNSFLTGKPIEREIPVFGAPFDENVFIVGIIDELRFDFDTYTLDLFELKTRTNTHLPSKSQQAQHQLQVMIYKKLFDDLVKGKVTKDLFSKHLQLDLNKELGEEIKSQVELHSCGQQCKNLSELLDLTFHVIQSLTCVNQLFVEYCNQESKQTLFVHPVEYSDDELHKKLSHYLTFWRGSRFVEGVEIEDAWKCQHCEFADVCEWRQQKAEHYAKKNKRNISIIEGNNIMKDFSLSISHTV